MENQETVVQNTIELKHSPAGYRAWYFTKEEYNELINYLSGSVSFAGTSGKYFLDKSITFPRYKVRASFEALNKKSINKRALAKNESYADYIVIPVKTYREILIQMREFMLDDKEVMYKDWFYNPQVILINHLCSLYNNYKHVSIIDMPDFQGDISSVRDKMTLDDVEILNNLFESNDSASVKLGMEMLTNYDFEKSILPIILVISKHKYTFKRNSFWSSTAFKSFRDTVYNRLNTHMDYLNIGTDTPDAYKLILRSNAVITESEYLYLRKDLYNYSKKDVESYSFSIDFTEEDVKLQIPAENIVPDDSMITDLTSITDEIIMSGDLDQTYDLIDDTTEDS